MVPLQYTVFTCCKLLFTPFFAVTGIVKLSFVVSSLRPAKFTFLVRLCHRKYFNFALGADGTCKIITISFAGVESLGLALLSLSQKVVKNYAFFGTNKLHRWLSKSEINGMMSQNKCAVKILSNTHAENMNDFSNGGISSAKGLTIQGKLPFSGQEN